VRPPRPSPPLVKVLRNHQLNSRQTRIQLEALEQCIPPPRHVLITSVAIRIRIPDPDRHQNLIIWSLAHCQPSLKISCKSVRKFLRKVANRQTDKQRRKHILLDRGKSRVQWTDVNERRHFRRGRGLPPLSQILNTSLVTAASRLRSLRRSSSTVISNHYFINVCVYSHNTAWPKINP